MATRTEQSTIPSFIFHLFFVVVFFFPIVRIFGLPILISVGFALVFLFIPIVTPRLYVTSAIIAAVYLIAVTLLTATRNDAAGFADMFYIVIPLLFPVLIALIIALSGTNRQQATYRLTRFAYLFLIFQFTIVSLQYLHPPIIDELLLSYLSLLAGNVTAEPHYLNFVFSRPGGTIVNPTWVGFAVYLFARYLTTYSGQYRYVFLALVITLMSSGRMALLTILIIETSIIFWSVLRDNRQLGRQIVKLLFLGVFVSIAFVVHPFLRAYLTAFLAGDLSSRLMSASITYRLEMYQWMFSNPEMIIRGGLVLAEAPDYIDSELIMRTLQFGFLGYLALKLPLFAFVIRSVRSGDYQFQTMALVVVAVALLSSLTTTTSSNMLFLPIYGVVIVASELAFNSHWDDEYYDHATPRPSDERQ